MSLSPCVPVADLPWDPTAFPDPVIAVGNPPSVLHALTAEHSVGIWERWELCVLQTTQIPLHPLCWALTLQLRVVCRAAVGSVLPSPALETESCWHCQGNLVRAQSCPTASRQPGAKALTTANRNPNGLGFFCFPLQPNTVAE